MSKVNRHVILPILLLLLLLAATACGMPGGTEAGAEETAGGSSAEAVGAGSGTAGPPVLVPAARATAGAGYDKEQESLRKAEEEQTEKRLEEARARLSLMEDYRDSFDHGDKGAAYQKYIVLHETEGDGSAQVNIDYWDSTGTGVAAHFVINKDGTIVQCVPLDRIAHHAGYGDTGHNAAFGVEDESRDDKVGTAETVPDTADYGMNSYSVGIELVHLSGSGDFPEAQLEALDSLIAYIDAYYGFESTIIDHKEWRSGNTDTSPEFSGYLQNYKDHRTHE